MENIKDLKDKVENKVRDLKESFGIDRAKPTMDKPAETKGAGFIEEDVPAEEHPAKETEFANPDVNREGIESITKEKKDVA